MEVVKKVFTDVNNPASYSGITNVLKEAKKIDPSITKGIVEDSMHKIKTYAIHKPRRIRFKRLQTVPVDYMTNMQADLADFQKVAPKNDGFRYLLVCIDVLSRMVFTAPVKSKSPKDMIKAFDKIFDMTPILPQYLFTDKGLEFQAKEMKEYYKKKDIQKHVAQSQDVKAAMAERCIRTIKQRLYKYFTENETLRWIDVIDQIVEGINNTVHRITKMKPVDVNLTNSKILWEKLYGNRDIPVKKPRYKEGDSVLIAREKGTFEKSYLPNYKDEVFTIDKVKEHKNPPNYRLVDEKGEQIYGKFYDQEFSKTEPVQLKKYVVEKVLEKRMRAGKPEYLVKWKGVPKEKATWIRRT